MTDKQREFIRRLMAEREMMPTTRERLEAKLGSMESKQASRTIEWLLAQPYAEEPVDLTGLAEGRYAVGDVLLRVDAPEAGRWAGFIFVKNGSEYADERYGMQPPDAPGYRGSHADVLRQVVADPQAAMAAYGRLTGSCGVCGRTLEDPDSVQRGIGPVCAEKIGAPAGATEQDTLDHDSTVPLS